MSKPVAFVFTSWIILGAPAFAQEYQVKAVSDFTGECRFQIPRCDLPRYDDEQLDDNGIPIDQWSTKKGEQQPCDAEVLLGELFDGRFFITFKNDNYIASLWGSSSRKKNPNDYDLPINTVNVLQPKLLRPGQWVGINSQQAEGGCHFLLSSSAATKSVRCEIHNRFGLTWNLHLDGITSFDTVTFPSVGALAGKSIIIPLQNEGGTFVAPIIINKAISLNFLVDSGAANVSIPADVVLTLIRTGTLNSNDFLLRAHPGSLDS